MTPNIFERIRRWLQESGVTFRVLHHEPVYTSEQAAEARGTPLASGAKALIVKAGERFIFLVLPADRKADSRKVKELLGVKDLRFATPEEIEKLTGGLKPGSIPPFGSFFRLKTYCDKALGENKSINFNAGDHSTSVQMTYEDYVTVENPDLVDVTQAPP
jgi:Ala-tRNA(Pro) deacylase